MYFRVQRDLRDHVFLSPFITLENLDNYATSNCVNMTVFTVKPLHPFIFRRWKLGAAIWIEMLAPDMDG